MQGREAAGRLAWSDAYTALSLADSSSPLAAQDLELLATAALLLGRVEDGLRALQRAHQLHAEAGDPRRAARCAFWLAFHLGSPGELAQAGGWFGPGQPAPGARAGGLRRARLPVAVGRDSTTSWRVTTRPRGSCRGAGGRDRRSRRRCRPGRARAARARPRPGAAAAGWARPWPCSTRPWSRSSPASSRPSSSAPSTAA